MNRRGFLSSLIAVPAAAYFAQFTPAAPIGTVGAIDRATCSFWRNQQTFGPTRPLTLAMMQAAYDKCGRGMEMQ